MHGDANTTDTHLLNELAALNVQANLGLDQALMDKIVQAAGAALLKDKTRQKWPAIVQWFKQDHPLVEALTQADHPASAEASQTLITMIAATVAQHPTAQTIDVSTSREDLEAMCLLAIISSLNNNNFSYSSKFSTWAIAVVHNTCKKHIRDMLYQAQEERAGSRRAHRSWYAFSVGDHRPS